jgi:flagellar hook-associated protein 3
MIGIRVTDQMLLGTVINNLQLNEQMLEKTQQQVSTGLAISQPSDDPFAASQILDFHQRIGLNSQLQTNLNSAQGWMEATDSALNSIQSDLQRARQLAIQGANDTLTSSDRQNIALEIHQILLNTVDVGNSKFGDEFIFAGTKTTTQPFVHDGSSQSPNISAGAASPVRYYGDAGNVTRQVDQAAQMSVNAAGTSLPGVFSTLAQLEWDLNNSGHRLAGTKTGIDPRVDKTSGFPGTADTFSINGVAIGDVVPNVKVNGQLHTVIGFAPSTPIQHVVNDINAKTSQTGVTASINSEGMLVLQLAPGASQTGIRISDVDTAAIDAATGQDLTVNGQPQSTGGNTAADLGLTTSPETTIGTEDVAAIDSELNTISTLRAQIGAKLNRVSEGQQRLSGLQITLQKLNSNFEDVDMATAVSNLATQQTTFQAALGVAAKVLPPTLLDFLR